MSPRIIIEFLHRAAPHVGPDRPEMPAYPTSWWVEIDGTPKLTNLTVLSASEGIPTYTGAAMRAVNAVPLVCAAQAGITSDLDLPMITGRLAATRHDRHGG